MRQTAAETLGALVNRDEGGLRALISRFLEKDFHGRGRDFISSLGAIANRDPEVRAALLAMLDDEQWTLRATVMKTLLEHSPDALDTERRLLPWLGAVTLSIGDKNHDYLHSVLIEEVRRAAAQRVATLALQDEHLVERLVEMSRHPEWRIREGAAMALLAMPGGAATACQGCLAGSAEGFPG